MDTRHSRDKSGDRSSNVIAMNFDATYFFERGVRFLQRNELSKALRAFRKTVEYEPNNPVNYCNLAGVLSEMGDFQASNELLEHVLRELDPNMAECQFYLANNYANMGEYDTAEEYVLRYLDADPDGEYAEDAEEMLGVLMDEFGGGRVFEKWQEEKRQSDVVAATKDGRYFLENGQFEAAVEWLEQVIQKEPENYAAYNNLCLAYYYTGQHDKALAMADDVLYRQPDNIHALCNRAILIKHFGWADVLEAAAEPLRKVFPLHYDLAMKVGTTLGIIGYHADALAKFRRLLRFMTPPEPVLLHAAAAAAANSRQWAIAERYWSQLVRDIDYRAVGEYYLRRLAEARSAADVDWRVSYQLDLPVEAQLAEVKDKLKDDDLDAWRRDPLVRASLYWGLRHGNHETRRRVIRALAVVADSDAEKALRLFVGRNDIDATSRLHALVALKRINAQGTVHINVNGEWQEIQLEEVDSNIIFELNPNWRAVWERTEGWLEAHHLGRLIPEAKRLWLTYLYDMFLHVNRRIGKTDIWVAGLLYITLRYFGVPVVQRELAEEFKVAPSSIRKCSLRLEQILLSAGI
ncbi:tetratricopeptide repeat protein [Alicyclobacillus dauci]|uniref:Tetratricopeptide repeat protein n=1 Tax=Alicyclobacillus dauci TaxID=1475485 RepID=A0ABY6Z1X4_9BACL|nr:tetratricopeptide repeat protein [Alicyclobacillus dauci]WAH36598.1 tetratricopeptide repeat protein [Alicyclobacillus dauci]